VQSHRQASGIPAPILEAWPGPPDAPPETQCRFTLNAPRNFLYPALLLLLAEAPSHGYRLVGAVNDLGLGRVDGPKVYRTLADLERDRLVRSWEAPPAAGSTRHMYAITSKGERALESWMSIVARERASLDLVLERYWYCSAQRSGGASSPAIPRPAGSELTGDGSPFETTPGGAKEEWVRLEVAPDRSNLVVEARSSVGPIAFSSRHLRGRIEAGVRDALLVVERSPLAELEARVDTLSSGNVLYDGELLRRIDARRFPTVAVALRSIARMGDGNCYRVAGDLTIHGVSRRLVGLVTATFLETRRKSPSGSEMVDRRMVITGEHVLDIRHFEMQAPRVGPIKIYPDVRLHLHLEADAV
jgi:DNA-binding PadR family transcriptional regulator